MSHEENLPPCSDCGGRLKSNGGGDGHKAAHAGHLLGHGLLHGNPLALVLGGVAAFGAAKPKRYICQSCGSVFKDKK